jgi:hypothetical protein
VYGPIPRSLFTVPDGFMMTNRARPPSLRTKADSLEKAARRAMVNAQVRERMHAIMCDP